MALVYNGEVIATNNPQVTLSRAEYDALSPEVKNDPSITFFIHDDGENDYKKLLKLSTVVGSETQLADYADGTIIGAIKELYDRIGGLSFAIDPEFNHIKAIYNDDNPNNIIQQLADNASDSEKIAHLEALLGDVTNLNSTGYDTIVGAIIDLYERLDNLSFMYRDDTNTVQVTDNA